MGQVFRFGSFHLDTGQQLLLDGRDIVPLEPKVFETLVALVEGKGRVVSKDELLRRIWRDSFVEEGSLARNVSMLRRVLGETTDVKYIETIPKRGYRFIAPIHEADQDLGASGALALSVPPSVASTAYGNSPDTPGPLPRMVALVIGITLAVGGALLWSAIGEPNGDLEIRSLAVLPLRSLDQDPAQNYIGLGIADNIIAAISRAPALTVRPTSTIRRFVGAPVDGVAAARELGVDAVLDGTWFREGDRLRVSVNLIRVADSRSLWSDTFDIRSGDLFAIQDQVASPIAAKLRTALTGSPNGFRSHGTKNELAYDAYLRGKFYFAERGFTAQTRGNSDTAVRLFEQAVAADPDFADAHAMLGFAYAWTAVFVEENPSLIARAEIETELAARLDDQLGQVHLNRGFMLFTWYRGWRLADAIRENRRALELDPGLSDVELGALYFHAGLYDEWEQWNLKSIAIDPSNQTLKRTFINEFFLIERPDEGLAMQRQLLGPGVTPDARYFLGKRMPREAEPLVEQAFARAPADRWVVAQLMTLRALQGRHTEAQALVKQLLAAVQRNRTYHHFTYTIARIHALGGRADDAIHWLQETVDTGFPDYPLFASDSFLDPIRGRTEFKALLARVHTQFEEFRRAAGRGAP